MCVLQVVFAFDDPILDLIADVHFFGQESFGGTPECALDSLGSPVEALLV